MGGPGHGYRDLGIVEVHRETSTKVSYRAVPVVMIEVDTEGADCEVVILREGSGYSDDEAYFESTCDAAGGLVQIGLVLPDKR